jgi:hypothetical protein
MTRPERTGDVLIRAYEEKDWNAVWELLEPVFRAGETYAFPLDISKDNARPLWTGDPRQVFVAVDQASGQIETQGAEGPPR